MSYQKKSVVLQELEIAIRKKAQEKSKNKQHLNRVLQQSIEKKKAVSKQLPGKEVKPSITNKNENTERQWNQKPLSLFNNEQLVSAESQVRLKKYNNRRLDKLISLIQYMVSSSDKVVKYINSTHFEAEFALKLFRSDRDNLLSELKNLSIQDIVQSQKSTKANGGSENQLNTLIQQNNKLKKDILVLEKECQKNHRLNIDGHAAMLQRQSIKLKDMLKRITPTDIFKTLMDNIEKENKFQQMAIKCQQNRKISQIQVVISSLQNQRHSLLDGIKNSKPEQRSDRTSRLLEVQQEKEQLQREIEVVKTKLQQMKECSRSLADYEKLKQFNLLVNTQLQEILMFLNPDYKESCTETDFLIAQIKRHASELIAENDKLFGHCDQLQTQIKKMMNQAEKVTRQRQQQHASLEEYQQQIEQFSQRQRQLQSKCMNFQQRAQQATRENQNLLQEIDERTNFVQKLSDQVRNLQRELIDFQGTSKQLHLLQKTLSSTLKEPTYSKLIEILHIEKRIELEDDEERINELQQRQQSLKNQITQLFDVKNKREQKELMSNLIQQENSQLKKEISALKNTIQQFELTTVSKDKYNELQKSSVDLQKYHQLHDNYRLLENKIMQISQQQENDKLASNKLLIQKIQSLIEENQGINQAIHEYQEDLSTKSAENAQLKKQLGKKEQLLSEMEDKVSKKQIIVSDIKEILINKEESLVQIKDKLSKQQSENSKLKDVLIAKEESIKQLEDALSKQSIEISELKTKIIEKQKQLDLFRQKGDNEEKIVGLSSKVIHLTEAIQTKESQLNQNKQDIILLQQKIKLMNLDQQQIILYLDEAKKQIEEKDNILGQNSKQLQKKDEQIHRIQDEKNHILNQMKQQKETQNSLKKQISILHQSIQTLTNQKLQLKDILNQTDEKYISLLKQSQALQDQINSKQQQLKIINNQLTGIQATLHEKINLIAKLKQTIDEQQTEKNQAVQLIQQLKKQLEDSKTHIQSFSLTNIKDKQYVNLLRQILKGLAIQVELYENLTTFEELLEFGSKEVLELRKRQRQQESNQRKQNKKYYYNNVSNSNNSEEKDLDDLKVDLFSVSKQILIGNEQNFQYDKVNDFQDLLTLQQEKKVNGNNNLESQNLCLNEEKIKDEQQVEQSISDEANELIDEERQQNIFEKNIQPIFNEEKEQSRLVCYQKPQQYGNLLDMWINNEDEQDSIEQKNLQEQKEPTSKGVNNEVLQQKPEDQESYQEAQLDEKGLSQFGQMQNNNLNESVLSKQNDKFEKSQSHSDQEKDQKGLSQFGQIENNNLNEPVLSKQNDKALKEDGHSSEEKEEKGLSQFGQIQNNNLNESLLSQQNDKPQKEEGQSGEENEKGLSQFGQIQNNNLNESLLSQQNDKAEQQQSHLEEEKDQKGLSQFGQMQNNNPNDSIISQQNIKQGEKSQQKDIFEFGQIQDNNLNDSIISQKNQIFKQQDEKGLSQFGQIENNSMNDSVLSKKAGQSKQSQKGFSQFGQIEDNNMNDSVLSQNEEQLLSHSNQLNHKDKQRRSDQFFNIESAIIKKVLTQQQLFDSNEFGNFSNIQFGLNNSVISQQGEQHKQGDIIQ